MITLEEAALATGGEWLAQPFSPETPLHGGVFDTRTLGSGAGGQDIFFALAGENGDGHDYLHHLAGSTVKLAVVRELAAGQGESAARPSGGSVTQPIGGYKGAILRTPDPLAALAALGSFLVRNHQRAVVAITGSYCKTTAK